MSSSSPTVYVVFDYVCPYAYIGKQRADILAREYDIEIKYLPWEIYPNAIPEGEEIGGDYPDAYRDWLDALADEVDGSLVGPDRSVNSNEALKGALYASDQGQEVFEAYHEGAFEAIWSRGENLGHRDVLSGVVDGAGMDTEGFFEAIEHHAYQFRLNMIKRRVEDRLGIQRVPTFVFGDQRIVGNDRFEPSLKKPLEGFLERRKALGADGSSTLENDVGLAGLA